MDAAARNQVRLFVLVALAFMPAVLLYGYARDSARELAVQEQEQEILQFVHVSAVEYQRLLDESETLLGALTEFPEISTAGPGCSRRLAAVLQHTPSYTTLSHIGLDGYSTCGSLTVEGDLYLGDRVYFTRAMATNRFSVGEYAVGRITGKPTVGVAYPIRGEGGNSAQAVLALSLDLNRLGNAASRINLPDQTTFTVLDRMGRVMVRVPEGVAGPDTVGAKLAALDLPAGLLAPYIDRGTDIDGVDRVFAVAPLSGAGSRAGGYLLLGVDEAAATAAVDAATGAEVSFLALAGLAVLVLAWLFGHYALIKPDAT